MKNTKVLLIILIGLTLTFFGGVVVYSTQAEIKVVEYAIYGAVGLIVLFSIALIFKRFKDEKKGLVTEDELSRNVKQKAAANSFVASFYLWTAILLLLNNGSLGNEIPLGIGIIGMALLFLGFWAYQSTRGNVSEYSN